MRPRQDVESMGEQSSATTSANNSDDKKSNWVSWLIPAFVLANIVVFVMEMYFNNCPDHMIKNSKRSSNVNDGGICMARFLGRFSFQPLMENPLLGPSSSTLEKLGALNWSNVINQNQGWRLISCVWLHAGIIHLLANVLSLILIGICLEQQFGFVRIGLIYLLSGLGGSIVSSLFIRNRISVGASGPLFGLLGAMLAELITNWSIYSRKIAALALLLVVLVINLGIGILPHVDNLVSIGGFLTGFLLGFILMARPQFGWIERHNVSLAVVSVKSKYKAYQSVLRALSLILLIAGFTLGLVMLFRGVGGYELCHWCRYTSCIPISKWKCN